MQGPPSGNRGTIPQDKRRNEVHGSGDAGHRGGDDGVHPFRVRADVLLVRGAQVDAVQANDRQAHDELKEAQQDVGEDLCRAARIAAAAGEDLETFWAGLHCFGVGVPRGVVVVLWWLLCWGCRIGWIPRMNRRRRRRRVVGLVLLRGSSFFHLFGSDSKEFEDEEPHEMELGEEDQEAMYMICRERTRSDSWRR